MECYKSLVLSFFIIFLTKTLALITFLRTLPTYHAALGSLDSVKAYH